MSIKSYKIRKFILKLKKYFNYLFKKNKILNQIYTWLKKIIKIMLVLYLIIFFFYIIDVILIRFGYCFFCNVSVFIFGIIYDLTVISIVYEDWIDVLAFIC